MDSQRKINLSEELCLAAEKRFGPQFSNVESLLDFILRELLQSDSQKLDLAEQKMLEDRLRNLGYL